MNVLFLSCNTGGGHNSACRAVYEKFLQSGCRCRMMDALEFSSEKVSEKISGLYMNTAVKAPDIFGAVYKLGGAISTSHTISPVYLANKLYAENLNRFIEENGFDAVVTTHLFPAEALTYIKKRKNKRLKFYFVGTDYTCIPFTEETRPDRFFIPHGRVKDAYLRRGVPEERVIVTGIPVSEEFCVKTDMAEARKALGIRSGVPAVLVMTGSMGFGNVDSYAGALLETFPENSAIIVLSGNNEKLKNELREKFGPRLRVEDFTEQVPLYMDACDVTLTKPGGLTSTEAIVKNVPLVHTAPIPGCESENAALFSALGMSEAAADGAGAALAALELCNNSEKREKMLLAQRENARPEAAEDILRIVKSEVGDGA